MTPEMSYIYEIYLQGSITRASAKLNITQPALSIALKKVETELGITLFDRSKKHFLLTEAGEAYIRLAEKIALTEQDFYTELSDLSNLQSGSLSIGGTHYINSYVLPPVIKAFLSRYPRIHLHLKEDNSGNILQMVSDGKIDLTVSCSDICKEPVGILDTGFSDHIFLCVPMKYLTSDQYLYGFTAQQYLSDESIVATLPYMDLSVFSKIPFILLTPENNLYQRSVSFLDDNHISPVYNIEANQLVTAYRLCLSGLGATFISSRLISQPDQNVIFYKINSPLTLREFHVVYNTKRYLSHAAREFIHIFNSIYCQS